MNRLIFPLAVALTAAVVAPAAAENSPASRLSLRGLTGVGLRVEPIAADALKAGLSTAAVRSAVESQLRKAGLPMLTPEQQRNTLRRPCLLVHVATSKLNTGEYLYSIHVEMTQWVASLANPEVKVTAAIPVPAKTWSSANVFGIAPGDQINGHIHEAVRTMVEEFLNAHQRANPSETAFRTGE
ncbi:MAG: hypothetical protein HQ567_02000 [Candidatus Nealsonbacteria bacterium]|nr:hypothetical protein [Candidatus Nealsonbacteria bacterium]